MILRIKRNTWKHTILSSVMSVQSTAMWSESDKELMGN
jgi:hypothetical protein